MASPRVLARRAGKAVLGLLALLAVLLLAAWMIARQSLPRYEGEILLSGLSGEVEVVRDANAIPHIRAQSWDDAFFALGYVHAQDRLWQMEMNRRIPAGRVSEVVGEKGLEVDKFMRTLGMRRVAEQNAAVLTPEARNSMQRYADGVNAWISHRSGPLPPEFLIFGIAPEPWTVADSVAWGKMMQWDLSGNWRGELFRLRLAARLSPTQMAEFLAPYAGDPFQVLPELKTVYAGLEGIAEKLASLLPPAPEFAVGSNNWVVSGAHTMSGKPLLANDPHLGLAAPAIWYFAHLNVKDEHLVGATFPGVPGVVLGHNGRIAWGATNTGPDVQDLFMEKRVGEDRYLTPEGPRPFDVREEVIRLRGDEKITIKVRSTRHGPIISDVVATAPGATPGGHLLSFSWTALAPDDALANASERMQHASDWNSFRESLRNFHAPQQSLVFADAKGDIGMFAPGRIPVRDPQNTLKGLAPAPGWDARYDWKGMIPFEELPQTHNPADGKVVTANHKIVGPDYRHHIAYDWATPHRAKRIRELLDAQPKHDVASFSTIQGDVTSLATRQALPMLLKPAFTSPRAQAWVQRMRSWDGQLAADKAEPLVYAAWMRELTRLVYADELGPIFKDAWDLRMAFMIAVLSGAPGADGTPQSRWCDNIDTAEKETCDQQIVKALDLALVELDKRFGKEDGWNWGRAHFAFSEHRPLGGVPVLERLANIRTPTGGDAYTVAAAAYRIGNPTMPFANRHAASMRAIYDLSDLDASRFMHSTGQSGHPLSPWYDNFAAPWSRNEMVPISIKPEAYRKGAVGTLQLKPAR